MIDDLLKNKGKRTMKVNVNFNPNLSGSAEAIVTNQSGKVEEYFAPKTDLMMMSSKPNVKSIEIVSSYEPATPEAIAIFNDYKNYLENN